MTNVYRIGVSLAMSSNSSQVLGVLGRELLGVHGKVKDLEKGFGRLKLAIGGALSIGAGLAILASFKAPLDEARKFEMAVTRFSTFGLGTARTREAADFAKQMNVTGSTYVENMKLMTEAQGVFRDSGLKGAAALHGAKLAAPILAKIDFANSALDDESKARMHAQGLSMLRFIEMRGGLNSPERFNQIADAGFKAIQSSGGNVNWELYRQFMSTAGVSAQGMKDSTLFGQYEPIIGELKSRAGTANMTAFNRLTGITRVPNQVAHDLVKQGLWDGSKIEWNSQGGIKRMLGNPLKDSETFGESQVDWYRKNIIPMYERMHLSANDMNREDALIGGRTGGMMYSLIRRQLPVIDKSVGAQRQQMGIEASYGAAGGTLNGKIIDMHAKYTNLMERLGEAVLPLAVKGLNALIPMITGLTNFVAHNPGKIALIAKGLVVLSAALIGLGVAAIGIAIFSGGWVAAAAAGIGLLVGGLAAMAVIGWDKIKLAAAAISDFIQRIVDAAGSILGFKRAAKDMPAQTGAAVPVKKGDLIWDPFGNHGAFSGVTNDPNDLRGPWGGRKAATPPPKAGGQPSMLQANLYIDGKHVGPVVAKVIAGGLGANSSGPARPAPMPTSTCWPPCRPLARRCGRRSTWRRPACPREPATCGSRLGWPSPISRTCACAMWRATPPRASPARSSRPWPA
jgi:hypothetical protein